VSFTWAATAVAAGDLDGDGDADLVVGTTAINPAVPSTRDQYGVRLFLNNGAGVFTDVSYPRIPKWVSPFGVVRLLDINNDGRLDIYAAYPIYSCSGGHVLGLNTGNGFFFDVTGQLPSATWACSFVPRDVAVNDFNGDGYLDVYQVGSGQNRLLLNRGTVAPGFFIDVTASNVPNVSAETYGALTGDFNGDGFPDIFVCNGGGTAAGIDRINLGSSTGVLSDISATHWPTESQPYPYPVTCPGAVTPVSSLSCSQADVDGDGDLDVAVAGWNLDRINMRNRLFMNTGTALFQDRTTTSLPYDTAPTAKLLFFKANGDGRPDLFVGNEGQSYVFLNGP
jgi:hypothetical protein